MAGKYMKRGAIIATIKSEQRNNAYRKRLGLTQHPMRAYACGCPDPNCGAFHLIHTDVTIPTTTECQELLSQDNRRRKVNKCWKHVKKKS